MKFFLFKLLFLKLRGYDWNQFSAFMTAAKFWGKIAILGMNLNDYRVLNLTKNYFLFIYYLNIWAVNLLGLKPCFVNFCLLIVQNTIISRSYSGCKRKCLLFLVLQKVRTNFFFPCFSFFFSPPSSPLPSSPSPYLLSL